MSTEATDKAVFQAIVKAIKALDEAGWLNKTKKEQEAIWVARTLLVNTLFEAGYEIPFKSRKLSKAKFPHKQLEIPQAILDLVIPKNEY